MWVCREGLCSLPRRDIGKSVGASDYAGIVRKSMCLGRGGGVDVSWRWRGRVVPRGDCRQSILSIEVLFLKLAFGQAFWP